MFVIDCSPAMLKPSEDGEIPFYTAIKCAMTVQLNKIISSESDLVGIVLYGTVSLDIYMPFRVDGDVKGTE